MNKLEKIYIAGHRGMVGSAITRALEAAGHSNLLKRTRAELDLADTAAVAKFFQKEKPETVIFAAAKVGGIKANNDFPVEFLIDHSGKRSSDRPARADERSLCHCQDCRDKTLPGLRA
jgi:GDP-L-fucose synthase